MLFDLLAFALGEKYNPITFKIMEEIFCPKISGRLTYSEQWTNKEKRWVLDRFRACNTSINPKSFEILWVSKFEFKKFLSNIQTFLNLIWNFNGRYTKTFDEIHISFHIFNSFINTHFLRNTSIKTSQAAANQEWFSIWSAVSLC